MARRLCHRSDIELRPAQMKEHPEVAILVCREPDTGLRAGQTPDLFTEQAGTLWPSPSPGNSQRFSGDWTDFGRMRPIYRSNASMVGAVNSYIRARLFFTSASGKSMKMRLSVPVPTILTCRSRCMP